ncbi:MAG: recombination mediator RecR [Oscillospiraceae bacterium]|nr:recombination mediator RecR [Oscillospiraceae bacterium]
MEYFSSVMAELIDSFNSLPSIGRKTAERLAFYVLAQSDERAENFAAAILNAKKTLKWCKICQNMTDGDECAICCSHKRDRSIICVVETPRDVVSMEKTAEFRGLYHVLHGVISPMDRVTAEDIRIKELLARVDGGISEVIMATNPTVEGEATAMYIAKLLAPMGVKCTRISFGLPIGCELEYADQLTLGKALEGRREICN